MTVQNIIDEVRAIVQETDPNNTHKTDAQILDDINLCTTQLCSNLATLPKAELTGVTAADTITIGETLLKLDYASISDGATTPQYSRLETIDFVNFARINPGWENAQDNKPTLLVRMTDQTWMMYPPPDATWTGKALTLIGTVLPAALTLTTQEPPISLVLHPAYPHYCAWKFFLLLNNPDRANAEYATFNAIRKINTQTATSTTGSMLQLKLRGF